MADPRGHTKADLLPAYKARVQRFREQMSGQAPSGPNPASDDGALSRKVDAYLGRYTNQPAPSPPPSPCDGPCEGSTAETSAWPWESLHATPSHAQAWTKRASDFNTWLRAAWRGEDPEFYQP